MTRISVKQIISIDLGLKSLNLLNFQDFLNRTNEELKLWFFLLNLAKNDLQM